MQHRDVSLPAYQRIAARYRTKILSGELAPGQRLPTEQELVEQFGVARQTARNGLGILVAEGLIVAHRPHGYFVRRREQMFYRPQGKSQPQPATPEMDRFCRQIVEEGRTPAQEIEVQIISAPEELATRLKVDPGTTLVARRRVRTINDESVNINDSYFVKDLVENSEIMLPNDIARGSDRVLADLGYPIDRSIDEIIIRMPTPDEIRRLSLGPERRWPSTTTPATTATADRSTAL